MREISKHLDLLKEESNTSLFLLGLDLVWILNYESDVSVGTGFRNSNKFFKEEEIF